MKRLIYIIFVCMFFSLFVPSSSSAMSNQTAIESGLQYLHSQQQIDGSINGFSGVTDWASQSFSADGVAITTVATQSGQSLDQNLMANLPATTSASTTWAKRILSITASGENPYDVNGVNLVSGLEGYYINNQIGSTAVDNDDIFGLLALLASKVDPASQIITDTTSFIISNQHSDGGFSYSTDPKAGSDIDDSASALMALVSAQKAGVSNINLQVAIDSAKSYILSHQNTDGGFAYDPNPTTSWDTTSNVSSTSWVIMAFAALGLQNDSHMTNAQTYILSTQQSDGSFPYQPSFPPGDTFDTSYALLALEGVYWPIHVFTGTIPTISPIIVQGTLPGATPTIVDTPAPTLTPTPTQPTTFANTQVPTPTITPAPSPIPAVSARRDQSTGRIAVTPVQTRVIPAQTAVLGAKTKQTRQQEGSTIQKVLAVVFFLLGVGFLGGHSLKTRG